MPLDPFSYGIIEECQVLNINELSPRFLHPVLPCVIVCVCFCHTDCGAALFIPFNALCGLINPVKWPKNGARPCSRTNLLSGSSARNCVLRLSSCVSRAYEKPAEVEFC